MKSNNKYAQHILPVLKEYPNGITTADISKITGIDKLKVSSWFSTTRKSHPEIYKLSKGTYSINPYNIPADVEDIYPEDKNGKIRQVTWGAIRNNKAIVRLLIAEHASSINRCLPEGISMLGFPGEGVETEKAFIKAGIKFKRNVGIECDNEVYRNIRRKFEFDPELNEVNKVTTLLNCYDTDVLMLGAEQHNARCKAQPTTGINIAWLDYCGPYTSGTRNALFMLCNDPAMFENSFNDIGAAYVFLCVGTGKWEKISMVNTLCSLAKENTEHRHIPTEEIQDEKGKLRLTEEYRRAWGIHFDINNMVSSRGLVAENIMSVYYRDSTQMLVLGFKIVPKTSKTQPEPLDPKYLGIENRQNLMKNKVWYQDLVERGIASPLEGEEAGREAIIKALRCNNVPEGKILEALKIIGADTKIEKTPTFKTTENKSLKDEVEKTTKVIINILKKSPSYSLPKKELDEKIKRELSFYKKLAETPVGNPNSGLSAFSIVMAQSKANLSQGQYIENNKNQTKLTHKGINLATKLLNRDKITISEIRNGTL
jgi:hypothetical protein